MYCETGPYKEKTQQNAVRSSVYNKKHGTERRSHSKSNHTHHTNTTAMVDEMSFPEERSVNFKINDFEEKNIRMILNEQEDILLNKIKKVNPEQKTLLSMGKGLNSNKVKYQPISKIKAHAKQANNNDNARVEITPDMSMPYATN